MSNRYTTDGPFTTASIASGANVDTNRTGLPDHFDIFYISITQSGTAGPFDVKIFKKDGFAAADLLAYWANVQPSLYYPIDNDTGSEAEEGFSIPYDDEDGTGEYHIRITNKDTAAHTYTVTTKYVEAPLFSTTGVKFRGVGPYSFGGATSSAVQMYLQGNLPTDSRYSIRTDTTLNPGSGADSYGLLLNNTIVEFSSGVHGNMGGIDIQIVFTNGAATATNVDGVNVRTFAAPTGTVAASGFRVASPSGATDNYIQQWLTSAGGTRGRWIGSSSQNNLTLESDSYGNNVRGPYVHIKRNENAGAEGPAAGVLQLVDAGGTAQHIWVDDSTSPGVVRDHNAAPTGSSGTPTVADTAGTVVGAQTSYWKLKSNILAATEDDDRLALDAIVKTPLYRYTLNAEPYKQRFVYVIHEEDRCAWFSYNDGEHQVPALDERMLFGYHAAAIKALERENQDLRQRSILCEKALIKLGIDPESLTA